MEECGEKQAHQDGQVKEEGGWLLFFDFVKNNLNNYSIQEFQKVDSHSENEVIRMSSPTHPSMSCTTLLYSAIQMSCKALSGLPLVVAPMLRWLPCWWEEGEYFHSAGKERAEGPKEESACVGKRVPASHLSSR
jgi:hypothetical protein